MKSKTELVGYLFLQNQSSICHESNHKTEFKKTICSIFRPLLPITAFVLRMRDVAHFTNCKFTPVTIENIQAGHHSHIEYTNFNSVQGTFIFAILYFTDKYSSTQPKLKYQFSFHVLERLGSGKLYLHMLSIFTEHR